MPNSHKFDDFLDREAVIDSTSDSIGEAEFFHRLEVNELSRKSVGWHRISYALPNLIVKVKT